MDRNLGHNTVLYAGRSSAELLQELLSWKVLRPVWLVGVGRWRMDTEVEQGSWTSSWLASRTSLVSYAKWSTFSLVLM